MKTPNPAQCAIALDKTPYRAIQSLSVREFQIFLLLGEGLSAPEIADLAGFKCSRKTVDSHFDHIRRKLGMEKLAKVRVFAATFIALHGRPKIEKQVCERRLVFKAA